MNKLSIGSKIAGGFTIILLLLVVIGFITFRNIKQMRDTASQVAHTHEVMTHIEQVLGDLKDAETGKRGFLITGMEKYLEPYIKATSQLNSHINTLKELTADNKNQQEHIEKLKVLTEKKLKELDEAINLRKTEGFDRAKELVISDLGKNIMNEIRDLLNNMKKEEETLLNQRNILSERSTKTATTNIIGVIILAVLIVIALTITFTRIIAIPIKQIASIANRISFGDLSQKIEITRKDEIGKLAESFKLMQETMQEKAKQAKEISEGNLTSKIKILSNEDLMGNAFNTMTERLRFQINEINEGINVLASSTSEVMAAVNQLASSSSETATSVGETSTTVAEVKQTAEVSSQKAKEVSENAVNATEKSKAGTQAIDNTINGMNKIKQQMESIANMVVNLSEQSQAVGDITATVNDLAEQSNLLAVNAAIESAKAGEHGKGFTVVAQEIKNLADRSKEATNQVNEILKDIQKSISSAVMATEEGGKAVEEGLNLTKISGESIKALSESISKSSNMAIQIAASSQQQLNGMDQIAAAMENIKESSTQGASSTQQVANSINDLQKLSDKLKELINQYKIEKLSPNPLAMQKEMN